MANRSTFNTTLPRDIGRFLALSQSPVPTFSKELRQLFKGPGVEGYDREIRKLFIEAHARHRGFKLQRLAREVVADLKKEDPATVAATA
jgi:hypothetical protein